MRGQSLRMKNKGHFGGGGAQNFEFQYFFFFLVFRKMNKFCMFYIENMQSFWISNIKLNPTFKSFECLIPNIKFNPTFNYLNI